MKINDLNKFATHPLQSFEWGEFRRKTNIKVISGKDFQLTIHPILKTPWTIGYLPKGQMPDEKLIKELKNIAKEQKCIFIQLEPNIKKDKEVGEKIIKLGLIPSAHPLFTPYTFELDLTQSEDTLLKNMHHKTRYNIKIAQKHNVKISEDNSDQAFTTYLSLTEETTKRQKFYAHSKRYHQLMWKTLKHKHLPLDPNRLTAHLFKAIYKKVTLASWILFIFKDTLYYPYGASSTKHREVMASNLMMWEVIKFGKRMGLKKFDMWGSLGPSPNAKDPWYGFHRFKQGYGATLIEFLGSFDLVTNPFLYKLYIVSDKLRWVYLRLKRLM